MKEELHEIICSCCSRKHKSENISLNMSVRNKIVHTDRSNVQGMNNIHIMKRE